MVTNCLRLQEWWEALRKQRRMLLPNRFLKYLLTRLFVNLLEPIVSQSSWLLFLIPLTLTKDGCYFLVASHPPVGVSKPQAKSLADFTFWKPFIPCILSSKSTDLHRDLRELANFPQFLPSSYWRLRSRSQQTEYHCFNNDILTTNLSCYLGRVCLIKDFYWK